MISPHFAKMEEKYPGVKLVKVDVEEQEASVSRILIDLWLTSNSKSLRSRVSRLCLLSLLTRKERRSRLSLELSPPRSL